MGRRSALALLVALLSGTIVAPATAQFAYPAGYGAWGWPGWGFGGATVAGDVAQGMGAFAAGAGAYNLQTAKAMAIEADTMMRWNEYLFQSQQARNRRYYEQLARRQRDVNTSREKIYRRLRDSPTASDLNRGDALNVALDEINDPKVYAAALKGATAKVSGELIRSIPFQYARGGITTSVDQLTRDGVPEPLKADTFAAEREALRQAAEDLRNQDEATGQLESATLEKLRGLLSSLEKKVIATFAPRSRERTQSERWIKAAYGLSRMLETPAINTLLAGVESRPDTTLGELLRFMKAFNLRFGVASTPRQRQAYSELFPLLRALRDEVRRGMPADLPEPPSKPMDNQAPEFFSAMDLEQLEKARPKLPETPAPRDAPKPPGEPK
jgi:hypothetical protein